MSWIEIRLDGKPIDKIVAARALSKVNGAPVRVCELGEDGSVARDVDVYAKYRAFGGLCGPEVNWSAIGSVSAAEARRYAEMISLAAELAEMAGMIAE